MAQNYNLRKSQKWKQRPITLDEDNPIAIAFRGYSKELDAKHDRRERIMKLSRDITIEAKRVIFLLHTIDVRKNNKAKIVQEAEERLKKLIEINFKAVAAELLGQDPYQYRNSFSCGLQEFIEAHSFMEYFKYAEDEENTGTLSHWNELQQKMHYAVQDERNEEVKQNESLTSSAKTAEKQLVHAPKGVETQHFEFYIEPTQYILGLSDLTGELMRRCINSVGCGEADVCLKTCQVLRRVYTGYIGLQYYRCRELSRKIFTMRQSLLKAENVCYNIKVRGGEAAKWVALSEKKPADDVDEGVA